MDNIQTVGQSQHVPNFNKKTRWQRFVKQAKDSKYLLILLFPTIVYYIIFEYLPMFGIVIAFKDYSVFKGVWASDWAGLKYFKLFFESNKFLEVLKNTVLLGVYSTLWGFPAPIILALLINEIKNTIFKRFVQTVSYLPHFISTVIVASMLVMFLSPTTGMINNLLASLGFERIYFLALPEWFRTVYIASGIWQGIGWGTIIYLAALTSIDPALYESAEIDGAGRWKKMWHITIPGLVPVMIILLILNIGTLIQIGFEKVFLLYNPLTYKTADIISTYVYRTGLVNGNYSYATAIGVFNGVTGFVMLYIANTVGRKFKEISLW